MKAGEFVVDLIVDAAKGQLAVREMVERFGDLQVSALGAGWSVKELAGRYLDLVQGAMDMAVAFSMFEAQTGLSSQALQRWQIVAAQVNVEAGAVAASITGLQRQMAEIRMGGGNVRPFNLLGINNEAIKRGDVEQVFNQLRQRYKQMDRATFVNLIQQMGISPEMVQTFRLTNDEFARFQGIARGMTEEQVGKFNSLKLHITQAKLAFADLGYSMVEFGAPIFDALAGTVSTLVKGFSELWNMGPSAKLFFGLLLAAISPVTAAIALALLLIQDLSTYMQGGKSLLGDAFKFWKSEVGRFSGPNAQEPAKVANWAAMREAIFGQAAATAGGPGGDKNVTVDARQDIKVYTAASGEAVVGAIEGARRDQEQRAYAQIGNQGY